MHILLKFIIVIQTLMLVLSLSINNELTIKNNLLTDVIKYQAEFESTQQYCIDLAVWHEARGEPQLGQYLVAKSIINRAKNNSSSPCEEVFKPNQYSFTTHYHNTSVNPAWNKELKRLGRIGNHIFYVEKKK